MTIQVSVFSRDFISGLSGYRSLAFVQHLLRFVLATERQQHFAQV